MKKNRTLTFLVAALVLGVAAASFAQLTPLENLGRLIAFDENLSTPPGQSCATCHHPSAGFADPNSSLPVSRGAIPQRVGNRNAPTWAYMSFSPALHWDETEEHYAGGQFWDGRANDLVEQAKGPFLNILEMNNPNKRSVVLKVSHSPYANLFREVFGPNSLNNVETAYHYIATAIAAYEASTEVNQFSSKFDLYMAGMAELTPQEMMGMALFNDPQGANCVYCHTSTPTYGSDHALFTDFSYRNIGLPKNWDNPFLSMPRRFNPAGADYIDYGLGDVLGLDEEMGKFKVPTLRNVAMSAPYMHNGIFNTLHEVVNFYSTRDLPGMWPEPEVPMNINDDEVGNLGLTADEVDAIVAFMLTLTDGYEAYGGIYTMGTGDATAPVASSYALEQNYPNPFNPATTISFALPQPGDVRLSVFNALGQMVATLVNTQLPAGQHSVPFDGSTLASGVYVYRIESGTFVSQKKMLLLK